MEGWENKLKSAILENKAVVISANCEVKYNGRAKSFLERGDRLVIIKPDNTLIIHQPTGSAPVNYMKSETTYSFTNSEDFTKIHCKQEKLKEYLDIKIFNIHFFNSHKLIDNEKLTLVGNEKDMSDQIYNNPDLIEKDFTPLSREEHTKYGFIDVFGLDKNKVLTVIECKRYNADLSSVTQLRRYVEKIKKAKGVKKCRGIIAAPKISSNAEKMLQDWGFSFVKVIPEMRLDKTKDQKLLAEF